MKCNCIAETADRLKTRVLQSDVSELRPKKGELESINAAHLLLSFGSGEWMLMIPFEAQWAMTGGKHKETIINVAASFCPFCGISLEENK